MPPRVSRLRFSTILPLTLFLSIASTTSPASHR
jgi:hypothetical protein